MNQAAGSWSSATGTTLAGQLRRSETLRRAARPNDCLRALGRLRPVHRRGSDAKLRHVQRHRRIEGHHNPSRNGLLSNTSARRIDRAEVIVLAAPIPPGKRPSDHVVRGPDLPGPERHRPFLSAAALRRPAIVPGPETSRRPSRAEMARHSISSKRCALPPRRHARPQPPRRIKAAAPRGPRWLWHGGLRRAAYRRGSTGSLSRASTARAQIWTLERGSPSTKRCSPSKPSLTSRSASENLRPRPRWRSLSMFAGRS